MEDVRLPVNMDWKEQGVKYIGFIDPDDFIDESMFRKLLRAAMTGSYDVSYCGYNEYYENTKKTNRVEDVLGWPYCDGTTDQRKIWDLIIHCRVAIWRGIYKKLFGKNQIHFIQIYASSMIFHLK